MRHPLLIPALALAAGLLVPAGAQPPPPASSAAQPPARSVEALLPQLLRAYHGGPYDVAAIRFAPELWAAMAATSQGRRPPSMLQTLFDGGLLFGVGPLSNWLAVAQQAPTPGGPVVGWGAPPSMRALLRLDLGQAEIVILGQRAEWIRHVMPRSETANLFNQLELLWFPLTSASGRRIPVDLARALRLVITGLAPDATQTFEWVLDSTQAMPQTTSGLVVGLPTGAVGAAAPTPNVAVGGGGLGGGVAPSAPRAAGPIGPPGAGGPAATPTTPAPPVVATRPATQPTEGFPLRVEMPAAQPTPTQVAALGGTVAGVNQVRENAGVLTVDYFTSNTGRREVRLIGRDGKVVDRLSAGAATPDGRGLASFRPGKAAGDSASELAFSVRNSLDTAQGSQFSETVVPVPKPGGAPAPTSGAPAAMALTLGDLSVEGDMLNVRVSVPPVLDGPTPTVPPLSVAVTDEAGRTVKELRPTPPAPGNDYVFAWDGTDQAGGRVPDGRYLLRAGVERQSEGGTARSEARYWVDVPLAQTERRLALLSPATALPLPAQIESVGPGRAVFAYAAPLPGRMTITAIDSEGRVVRRLLDQELPAGPRRIVWDGRDADGKPLPGGVYTVQWELDAGDRGGWGVVAVELPFIAPTQR